MNKIEYRIDEEECINAIIIGAEGRIRHINYWLYPNMRNRMWNIVRAVLLDKRLVSVGCLLLFVVFVDSQLPCGVHPIVSELDILEHFLFGFVLSDLTSKIISSMTFTEVTKKKWQGKRVDLLIRLSGFFVIGVVLWELSELLVFPNLFGSTPDPFFSFPITLTNIDGTVDVTIGAIGCLLAWYLAK